jgi:flagellar basal-body rod modification protein FlgD
MSSIPPLQPIAQSQAGSGGLGDVDIDEFLNLLLTELKNQDPLDPLDNSEMAQQISQIREIAATDKLSATLSGVLTGQSLATASNLIGREVEALTAEGETVRGEVDKVTVDVDQDTDARLYRIHVGEQSFALENVREITQ